MLGSHFPASGIFLSGGLCFYRYLQSLPCRFLGAVQPLGLLWDPGAGWVFWFAEGEDSAPAGSFAMTRSFLVKFNALIPQTRSFSKCPRCKLLTVNRTACPGTGEGTGKCCLCSFVRFCPLRSGMTAPELSSDAFQERQKLKLFIFV